jgi:hypothetical protein
MDCVARLDRAIAKSGAKLIDHQPIEAPTAPAEPIVFRGQMATPFPTLLRRA